MLLNQSSAFILSRKSILSTPIPEKGAKIYWEDGLGLRVTSTGKKSFVYKYYFQGRPRTLTIGPYPAFTLSAARNRKDVLVGQVKSGLDPLEEIQKKYKSPSLKQLADEFKKDHLQKHCKRGTQNEYERLLNNYILPVLGNYKCQVLRKADVKSMHNKYADTPYQANRCMAVIRKLLNYGIEMGYLEKNPSIGIKTFPESKRERWLHKEELKNLIEVLQNSENKRAARAILLLIFTGARKSEVLTATWEMFNLADGIWTKPSHHTKQRKLHHVPLNKPAVTILKNIRAEQEDLLSKADNLPNYVFPGDIIGQPLKEIKRFWDDIRESTELLDVRIHDLRHTYASHLVSNNVPLQIVGQLLGHTEMQTTMRYAHLADSALKEATDIFEKVIKVEE